MNIEPVPLQSIDLTDDTFVAGFKGGISPVRDSIDEIGLINFPVLREVDGKLQVVTGWKRIMAAKELGWGEITSKVYGYEELPDEACLKYIYHDNSGRMDDMELAELLVRFRDMLGIGEREMINDTLPFLGVPPSRKQLDRLTGLAALDDSIKDAYYRERITIEQCQMLSETPIGGAAPVLARLIDEYKLNNNESRQVIKDVEEIVLRDGLSPAQFLNELRERTEGGGKEGLGMEIRKIRYPDRTRIEEDYAEALNDLSLPGNVTIHTEPHSEGNDMEIHIKAGSSEELSTALSALESAAIDGRIRKIISIVREVE